MKRLFSTNSIVSLSVAVGFASASLATTSQARQSPNANPPTGNAPAAPAPRQPLLGAATDLQEPQADYQEVNVDSVNAARAERRADMTAENQQDVQWRMRHFPQQAAIQKLINQGKAKGLVLTTKTAIQGFRSENKFTDDGAYLELKAEDSRIWPVQVPSMLSQKEVAMILSADEIKAAQDQFKTNVKIPEFPHVVIKSLAQKQALLSQAKLGFNQPVYKSCKALYDRSKNDYYMLYGAVAKGISCQAQKDRNFFTSWDCCEQVYPFATIRAGSYQRDNSGLYIANYISLYDVCMGNHKAEGLSGDQTTCVGTLQDKIKVDDQKTHRSATGRGANGFEHDFPTL